MGRETPASLGRKVIIKTHRKFGNGAKGGGRKGQTGKRGIIYKICGDGTQAELVCIDESTFKTLSKKLFATGFIPRNVTINPNGETFF